MDEPLPNDPPQPDRTGHEGRRVVRRIFMVYDAKTGWLSAVKDSMMKVVGSGCSLCFVTHGLAGKRKETRELEKELDGTPLEYRHIDELEDLEIRLGAPVPKPSVLVELDDDDVVVLMDAPAIARLRTLVEHVGASENSADREQASLRGALKFYLAAKGIASPFDPVPV